MNQKFRKGIKIVLLFVFIGSAVMYGIGAYQSYTGTKEYEEAAEIANLEEISDLEKEIEEEQKEIVWREVPVYDDPYLETLEKTDLEALKEINEDVIGWIVIPNTKLSYPIVKGEDNSYYLDHTWKGVKSALGAIYMEQYNSQYFDDFHTILYGHRMIDGSMFGLLKKYKTQEFFEKYPYVYIKDDNGCHRYEIFAAYETSVESGIYTVGKFKEDKKKEFIRECLASSVIDTGIEPEITDRILTLSTCTGQDYDDRWVVHARLRGIEEERTIN